MSTRDLLASSLSYYAELYLYNVKVLGLPTWLQQPLLHAVLCRYTAVLTHGELIQGQQHDVISGRGERIKVWIESSYIPIPSLTHYLYHVDEEATIGTPTVFTPDQASVTIRM